MLTVGQLIRQLEHLPHDLPVGAIDVDRVAGVLAVAAERDAAAVVEQPGVVERARHALPESEVGPRARGDRGVVVEELIDLVIVDVDGVRDEDVWTEHPESGEVVDRTFAGTAEVRTGVGRAR